MLQISSLGDFHHARVSSPLVSDIYLTSLFQDILNWFSCESNRKCFANVQIIRNISTRRLRTTDVKSFFGLQTEPDLTKSQSRSPFR
jgi:hypothetical protein